MTFWTDELCKARQLAAMLSDAYAAANYPGGPAAWQAMIEAKAARLSRYEQAIYRAEARIVPLERTAQAAQR